MRIETRAACVAIVCLVVLSPALAAAQPNPPPIHPSLVVDGTVLEVQTGAPLCGTIAVAIWARIRVDAIRTPVGGLVPSELIVMVQCPGSVAVGDHRRFELISPRPTRGDWTMFTVFPSSPPRTAAYWTLRATVLSGGPSTSR